MIHGTLHAEAVSTIATSTVAQMGTIVSQRKEEATTPTLRASARAESSVAAQIRTAKIGFWVVSTHVLFPSVWRVAKPHRAAQHIIFFSVDFRSLMFFIFGFYLLCVMSNIIVQFVKWLVDYMGLKAPYLALACNPHKLKQNM